MYECNLLLVMKKNTLFFLLIYSFLRLKSKVFENYLRKAQIEPLSFILPCHISDLYPVKQSFA